MSGQALTHLDSSVLIAALHEGAPEHAACRRLVERGRATAWTHALAEAFAILTGGRLDQRLKPSAAAELLRDSIVPHLRLVDLDAAAVLDACDAAETAGVRGGAIYDFLHLRAAAAAGAKSLVTLNVRHFRAVARAGDPAIEAP